jgi:hypothetical protein
MISYFIPINYYPYYRLPTMAEINKFNAEAMVAYEEAKSKNILNKLLWTETYFKMREINKGERKKEADPPVDHERAKRLAKKAAPRPLSEEQFDKVSGAAKFPIVLKDNIFQTHRINLEYQLKEFVRQEDKDYDSYNSLRRSIEFITSMLKENSNKYEAAEYGKARTFLDSLLYEVLKLV